MIHLLVTLMIALFVTSCNPKGLQEEAGHADCIEQGWVTGTPAYDRCRYAHTVVTACGGDALCALEYMRYYDAQQNNVQPLTQSQREWLVKKTVADAEASIEEFKNARDPHGRLLYPHFGTVRYEMGKLMQQASDEGVSLTLQQAYYIAVANMGLD
jgi:hypothetical protein